ncbi:YncE family protein [Pseudonocardiaceae bacterium YIM PH 21723]|nr:YncE family protein [Pseudonocardiaceae bacterium YIM PH 21723]
MLTLLGASGLTLAAGSPSGDVLAVVEKGAGRLAFFDTGTGARLDEILLQPYPHEMAVDSTGRWAYIGHYGVEFSGSPGEGGSAVFQVDLHRRELVRTISTASHNRIHGVRLDCHDRLYSLSEATGSLLTGTRAIPTGGRKTHLFTLSQDGERAYVTGLDSNTVSLVRPHDPAAEPVVAQAGTLPEGSCLSADERLLYVGARKTPAILVFDAHTMRLLRSHPVQGDPLRIYPVGDSRLLVTDLAGKSITLYDSTFRSIWSITLSGMPSGASFHPSRPIAYVSLLDINTVTLVDLRRGTIEGSLATGMQPDSSAVVRY